MTGTVQARVWATRRGVRWRMFVVRGDRCLDLRKPEDGWLDVAELEDLPGEWLYVADDARRAPENYGGKSL